MCMLARQYQNLRSYTIKPAAKVIEQHGWDASPIGVLPLGYYNTFRFVSILAHLRDLLRNLIRLCGTFYVSSVSGERSEAVAKFEDMRLKAT